MLQKEEVVASLEEDTAALRDLQFRVNSEIDSSRRVLGDLERQNLQLQSEKQSLESKVQNLTLFEQDRLKLQAKQQQGLAALSSQKADLQTKLSQLKLAIDHLSQLTRSLQLEVDSHRSHLGSMKEQRSHVQSELAQMQKELQEASERLRGTTLACLCALASYC